MFCLIKIVWNQYWREKKRKPNGENRKMIWEISLLVSEAKNIYQNRILH